MFSPCSGFLWGLPPHRIEHYAVFGLRISDDPSPTRMFHHRSSTETTPETRRKNFGYSWELGCCRSTGGGTRRKIGGIDGETARRAGVLNGEITYPPQPHAEQQADEGGDSQGLAEHGDGQKGIIFLCLQARTQQPPPFS